MAGKWMICPICKGEGSYVNPNIDSNGLSGEDFADDPDFAADYMSGAYDVTCSTCNGRGSILRSQWKSTASKLAQAAADRRLAAMEDGQDPSGWGDYRYGY